MRSLLVLTTLVAFCRGQYNYQAPQASANGGGFRGSGSSSFGGQSSGFSSSGFSSSSGGSSGGIGLGSSGGIGLGNSLGGGIGLTNGISGGVSSGGGYSSGGSSGGGYTSDMYSGGSASFSNQAPIIHKHVYVHVAPEEPEEIVQRRPQALAPPQKHYKIIFVKTPSPPAYQQQSIPLQQQNEEKTLVYVLVKKPDDQPDLVIPTSAPTQPSKPEVYFIKYKTQKQAGSSGIVDSGISSGGIGVTANSGGSGIGSIGGVVGTSSGSSSVSEFARGGGAPAPKYGPPGYQS